MPKQSENVSETSEIILLMPRSPVLNPRDATWNNKQTRALNAIPEETRIAAVRNLPLFGALPGSVDFTPEVWAVSFTQVQENMWYITMVIEHIGTQHHGMQITGKFKLSPTRPNAKLMTTALLSAMQHPETPQLTGPPHRPFQLFVAYRLKHCYEDIVCVMQHVGVQCVLETEEAARATARQHGTDYLGRNLRKCAQCAASDCNFLKTCGGCGKVEYCGKHCQQVHWKSVHKKECRNKTSSGQ